MILFRHAISARLEKRNMAKILIVEDDLLLHKMYRKKFEVAGFVVDAAYDGEEAIGKMKTFAPDIVLLDVMMPKLNGIQVLEKAQADSTLRHIPVIVLTNLGGAIDAQTALKKGAVSYMVKSDFTPSEVVAKVQEFLSTRKVG